MPPVVATSTSMYLVLLISISSVTQFAVAKLVVWNYAAWTGLISVASTVVGVKVVNEIIKRTGRQSVLVLILATLIVISFAILSVKSIEKLSQ